MIGAMDSPLQDRPAPRERRRTAVIRRTALLLAVALFLVNAVFVMGSVFFVGDTGFAMGRWDNPFWIPSLWAEVSSQSWYRLPYFSALLGVVIALQAAWSARWRAWIITAIVFAVVLGALGIVSAIISPAMSESLRQDNSQPEWFLVGGLLQLLRSAVVWAPSAVFGTAVTMSIIAYRALRPTGDRWAESSIHSSRTASS